jgi:hypothetical protein
VLPISLLEQPLNTQKTNVNSIQHALKCSAEKHVNQLLFKKATPYYPSWLKASLVNILILHIENTCYISIMEWQLARINY